MEAFGARLRAERVRLGFTQEEFGEKAGISKNSVIAYEKGRTSVNAMMMMVFADLGVDMGYVFSGARSDGKLDVVDQQLLTMIGRLSMREREAVFGLVAVLAGETIDLGSRQEARPTVHDRRPAFHTEPQ